MPHDHLQVLKNTIARNLFVDTADQNYVVARWCYQRGLALDFLWNATHCLEKYMKGALLLNGLSGIRSAPGEPSFGHDLTLMYPEIERLAGDLLPLLLVQPTQVAMNWRPETPATYLARLHSNGEANNRYHLYGHTTLPEDLYKLDKMVFEIRRLCCDLGYALPELGLTYHEILSSDPAYMPYGVGSAWQRITRDGADPEMRRAALNHNVLFAPDYHHGTLRTSFSAANPVLGMHILKPDEDRVAGAEAATHIQLIDWVVQNVYLPGSVKRELREVRDRFEERL